MTLDCWTLKDKIFCYNSFDWWNREVREIPGGILIVRASDGYLEIKEKKHIKTLLLGQPRERPHRLRATSQDGAPLPPQGDNSRR
jgi:hypothetical protein